MKDKFDKWGFLKDLQMISIVIVLITSIKNIDGSLLGILIGIFSFAFVLTILYLRNWSYKK